MGGGIPWDFLWHIACHISLNKSTSKEEMRLLSWIILPAIKEKDHGRNF
jgi:hypothetical protein